MGSIVPTMGTTRVGSSEALRELSPSARASHVRSPADLREFATDPPRYPWLGSFHADRARDRSPTAGARCRRPCPRARRWRRVGSQLPAPRALHDQVLVDHASIAAGWRQPGVTGDGSVHRRRREARARARRAGRFAFEVGRVIGRVIGKLDFLGAGRVTRQRVPRRSKSADAIAHALDKLGVALLFHLSLVGLPLACYPHPP